MFLTAYSDGKGFSISLDYPILTLVVNAENIHIKSSYNELLALQNLISEKLADHRKIQEKIRNTEKPF